MPVWEEHTIACSFLCPQVRKDENIFSTKWTYFNFKYNKMKCKKLRFLLPAKELKECKEILLDMFFINLIDELKNLASLHVAFSSD